MLKYSLDDFMISHEECVRVNEIRHFLPIIILDDLLYFSINVFRVYCYRILFQKESISADETQCFLESQIFILTLF